MYITVVEYVYNCISLVYESILKCIPNVYDNVYGTGGSNPGASVSTFGNVREARLRAPIAHPLLTKKKPKNGVPYASRHMLIFEENKRGPNDVKEKLSAQARSFDT